MLYVLMGGFVFVGLLSLLCLLLFLMFELQAPANGSIEKGRRHCSSTPRYQSISATNKNVQAFIVNKHNLFERVTAKVM